MLKVNNNNTIRYAIFIVTLNILSAAFITLTHFKSLVSFYASRKHKKTKVFLFLRGIERDQWHEISQYNLFIENLGHTCQVKSLSNLDIVITLNTNDIYNFKANNGSTRIGIVCNISWKLTIKIPERRQ